MSVLDEGGDIYTVVVENGGTYRVERRETGRCTCPDAQYNLPAADGRERCKHEVRVAYATGDRPVPAWIDTDAVDLQLGTHVGATPRVAATDGGADIIDAGDEGEILDDEGGSEEITGTESSRTAPAEITVDVEPSMTGYSGTFEGFVLSNAPGDVTVEVDGDPVNPDDKVTVRCPGSTCFVTSYPDRNERIDIGGRSSSYYLVPLESEPLQVTPPMC